MTPNDDRLWAKGWTRGVLNPPSSVYLRGHLRDVTEAAGRVLDATAASQLAALGLDPAEYRDRFRRCVLLAAAVHDLGKANDHFQGMLLGSPDRRDRRQGLRHEWVTVLMLRDLRDWLLPAVGGNKDDFALVEWAVSGHHPAYNHASPPKRAPEDGAGVEIYFHTGHDDFVKCLEWLCEHFGLATPLPTLASGSWPLVGSDNIFGKLKAWEREAGQRWERLQKKPRPEAKLLAALRNSLIAADVAGSALPRQVPDESRRWAGITEAFARLPAAGDLQFLADYGLEGQPPRAFQTAVADHPADVVLVKAGCGTGKTVAAYLRAARQWQGRRLYFCYPTTGTATEGFKDYLYPEVTARPTDADTRAAARLKAVNADLFHSRSAVDFDIILGTGGDTADPDADAATRAESLRAWATPVVACTVDTVLGVVQNNKRGLFGWPALSQSAFVFDEIHAYDDRLFGALLRFLRDLPGLPALLMTASLPAPREEALREVLSKFRGIDLSPIGGPKVLENQCRYHREGLPADVTARVAAGVRGGGKVLWVSNVVSRVIASADAATAAGLKPLIYHSRFKYIDRVRRHKDVSDAFKHERKEGVIACTSQVCEMSLDLKGCTLLVTELAPVPALIQRLGRLNRDAKPGAETRPFIVLDPGEKHLPYSPADLEAARKWLTKLPAGKMSQADLAAAWEQSADNPPDLVASAWLDGGPRTSVTELREASPGITVIMEQDVSKATGSHLGRYTLPMPRHDDWRSWGKHRGLPVAPTGTVDYNEVRGAEWRK